MKNELPHSRFYRRVLIFRAFSIASLNLALFGLPSLAQSFGSNDLPKEREIHNTFSQDQKNGALLDATNPMELINRLRQATAMDDATSPSDAIDEALKALDDMERENSSIRPK